MYLSLLEIDATTHIARTWLGNPYRVHQRLSMAFPGSQPGRVLFRIEDEWSPPRIIVQAEAEADWDAAFRDLPVLAARSQQRPLDLAVSCGDVLRFRLRANPTKRLSAGCPGKKVGRAPGGSVQRRRSARLARAQGGRAGFELAGRRRASSEHNRQSQEPGQGPRAPIAPRRAVRRPPEGHGPQSPEGGGSRGYRTGKAYGFGLLSLAR